MAEEEQTAVTSASDPSRRETVGMLVGAIALTTADTIAAAATPSSFLHGVASGDPTTDSVVLWTRVTTAAASAAVRWEMSRDPAFRVVDKYGTVTADAERDHTVKVAPGGLKPGEIYHYRFWLGEEVSPVGRARTLPVGRLDRLGLALASCSNYALGYFNAYEAIANDPEIEFILHTGDYIYEHANDTSRRSSYFVRPCQPVHETVSLADYRLRHATHKADPQSQRMHAMHPLLALWDDHDVANDSWRGGAENHHPATQGDWEVRKAAAIQAYFEWMPVREPNQGEASADFWRTYSFGDLATLVTLETRLTARSQQVDYGRYKEALKTTAERDTFVRDVLGDPAREMMAPAMAAALSQALSKSVRERQPWRIIGNGVLLSRVCTPDLRKAGITPDAYPPIALLDKFTDVMWRSDRTLPQSTDSWDGYGAARDRFYGLCHDVGATDLLVLTGDSHCFWSNDLTDAKGAAMGIEIGTAGVSIPNDFALAGCGSDLIKKIDALYVDANDDVRWTSGQHRGYVRIVLHPTHTRATFIAVETARPGVLRQAILRREEIVRRGTRSLARSPGAVG